MNERYELTTGPGRLSIHKLDRGWRRDRMLVVCDSDGTRLARRDFPADLDAVDLDGLPADRECIVHVMHRNPLKRLFAKPLTLRAAPGPRRLRALISGSGRCGTASVSRYLDGLRYRDGTVARSRHETLWEHILPLIAAGNEAAVAAYMGGFTHSIEAAPHFSLVPGLIAADKVVHLIRDGRRVVQSGLNRDWYVKKSSWNAVKPDFPGDVFEKCCRFWEHTCRNMAGVADLTVRLEDLAASPDASAALAEALDLESADRPFPLANTGRKASTFDHWSRRRHAVFEEICGGMMDRHYPGWRD